jgi:hypothetical protein
MAAHLGDTPQPRRLRAEPLAYRRHSSATTDAVTHSVSQVQAKGSTSSGESCRTLVRNQAAARTSEASSGAGRILKNTDADADAGFVRDEKAALDARRCSGAALTGRATRATRPDLCRSRARRSASPRTRGRGASPGTIVRNMAEG